MKKANLIIIGAVIIGLGIGTAIGLQQIKNTKTTIAEESNKASETAQTSDQVLVEYYQTRTAEQREAVMEKIKSIFGEDLAITFKEAKTRYYTYGIPDPATITDFAQLKVIETYEDNKGFRTEVDVENNEILNRGKDCIEGTKWITADQAKESAQNLLAKLVPDPENYRLRQADAYERTYYTDWAKAHEGDFYNLIPDGKGQSLAKSEWRTIVICDLSGELFSYEYKPALTEKEITEIMQKWQETQKKDIAALRTFLNKPEGEFTFVNWINYGTKQREIKSGENETITESYDYKTFRAYRDENGYCYDVGEDGSVLPDTEILKDCKTPKL
jgi:hypothetical protein